MIKLMKKTFFKEKETKEKLCKFIMDSEQLSMGSKCKQFEKEFSEYQGRKHSVLFNSGSSANLALIQALVNMGKLKKKDSIGFSALTWATNVMPLLQCGLNPVPLDVSLRNLNVNSENLLDIEENLKALFITNLLGFSGDLDKIKKICDEKGIILLEDNCESLGSELGGKKLGNFSLASTFSFFVGHHMSTIEGGMVCTDDDSLYEMLLMVRAHGWSRELSEDKKKEFRRKNEVDSFYDLYTFYTLGYNLRPTEITGFIGCEQLKYLEETLKIRERNFKAYDGVAKQNPDFQKSDSSHMNFISNFTYPVIFKDKETFEKYKKKFSEKVEIRPLIGSLTYQPFFKNKIPCPNAEKLFNLGFYIPNNPDLTDEEVKTIQKLLSKD